MILSRSTLASASILSALCLGGCGTGQYNYADDVKIQFAEGEKEASVKNQLGCEGSHAEKEDKDAKKTREDAIPKTDVGTKWLGEACRIADDFDSAGPVTSWPESDQATWLGRRYCRTQIDQVVKPAKEDDPTSIPDTAFVQVERLYLKKGAGTKLWAAAPDVPKDKVLDFNASFLEISLVADDKTLAAIDEILGNIATRGTSDAPEKILALKKTRPADDQKKDEEIAKLVAAHTVPGIVFKSEGTSTLVYPVLGDKGDPSAIHYFRQKGSKLLVVTPMIGASQPSACVAELTLTGDGGK